MMISKLLKISALVAAAAVAGCTTGDDDDSSTSSSGGGGGSCGSNSSDGSATLPSSIPTFTLGTKLTASACYASADNKYWLFKSAAGGPFTTTDEFTVTTKLLNPAAGDSLYVCIGTEGTYSDCDTVHTVSSVTPEDTDMDNNPNDQSANEDTLYILVQASGTSDKKLDFEITVTKE